jgi:c-di-GMP phosphodiesterase
MGLARARFCELLSNRLQADTDLFLMGLLSIMDAIFEVPMDVLMEQLPVDHETKAALLGQNSSLRPLYQLMLAQESGEWTKSSKLTKTTETARWGRRLNLVAGAAVGTSGN